MSGCKCDRFHVGDRVRVTFDRQAPYDPPVLDGVIDAVFRDEVVVMAADGSEHWAFLGEVEYVGPPKPKANPDDEIHAGFGDKWLP